MWNAGEIHHIIRDKDSGELKVAVFLRELRHSVRYYARFKIDDRSLANGQRYVTESLRTDDLDTALERARRQYALLEARQNLGVAIKQITVNEAIDKFLKDYESKLKHGISGFSKSMARIYRKTVDIYWREYIGQKTLDAISVSDFEDYELWRQDWSRNTKRKRKHGNYKDRVTQRTIQFEINAFKAVLRWCAWRKFYNGRAYEWRFKLTEKNRRSALTLDQYVKLYRYLRTNKFLERGKHGNDSRIRRHRVMLRTYILFMANTGLRVGEARYLKWRDIEEDTNKLGQRVLLARVSQSHSKVRKTRHVVGRTTALKVIERWRKHLLSSGKYLDDDSYIFCDQDGNAIKDFREGFNSVIREAGVETDRDGNKYTIYSLRHFYITMRLRFGKGLRIHSLAKNCGTSVAMIEQFYSDAIPTDFKDELTI